MKTSIFVFLFCSLTGCAQMYDRQDICQRTELIERGQYPSYCGGGTRYVTRDYKTNRPLTTTKAER